VNVLVLIGRIMFVVIFLSSGVGHLTATDALAGYAQSKGVPSPRPVVMLSGVVLLVGAIMVLLGLWIDLGALLLLAFLVPTALLMHAFWRESDPQNRQMEQIQFMKDLALAGAALFLFAFTAYLGSELGLTLTEPLFDLS
jgi:uncharacterized membrane protein YphA (DoxX/SURF4 family)